MGYARREEAKGKKGVWECCVPPSRNGTLKKPNKHPPHPPRQKNPDQIHLSRGYFWFYMERERIDPGGGCLTGGAGWVLKGSELCTGTEARSTATCRDCRDQSYFPTKFSERESVRLGLFFYGKHTVLKWLHISIYYFQHFPLLL